MEVRIGILGAARIAPRALIEPARRVEGVEVAAVASRDPERAARFAREHGIPRVFPDYASLIGSDAIDAVYVPLPIAHHCTWSVRALEAGHHVLCEKAFACNAAEALRMAEAARRADRVLMEAFHWRYHPLADRLVSIVRGGGLGTLRSIRAGFTVPHARRADIRLAYATGGGATLDLGCYPIHMLRHLTGEEPEVLTAEAETGPPDVDVRMHAALRFPSGARGEIACSLRPQDAVGMELRAEGSRGRLRAVNVVAPQIGNALEVEVDGVRRSGAVEGEPTFVGQLRAFVRAVREGAPVPTDADDAVRTLRVIDAVYRAAGLRARGEQDAPGS